MAYRDHVRSQYLDRNLTATPPLTATLDRSIDTNTLNSASDYAMSMSKTTAILTHKDQGQTFNNTTGALHDKAAELRSLVSQLETELAACKKEIETLEYEQEVTQKTKDSFQIPLDMVARCFSLRSQRPHSENIDDDVQKSMTDQTRALQNMVDMLSDSVMHCGSQLADLRQQQRTLEEDLADKNNALNLDEACLSIKAVPGAMPKPGTPAEWSTLHTMVSPGTPSVWLKETKVHLGDSITSRKASANLRADCLEKRKLAANTEKSVRQPSINTLLQSCRLYDKAEKTLQSKIDDAEKHVEAEKKSIAMMEKSIANKQQPLQVAQERLALRQMRPSRELTADISEANLTAEVETILKGLEALNTGLEADKQKLAELLALLQELRFDLKCKQESNALDRQCHAEQSAKTGVLQWYECLKY